MAKNDKKGLTDFMTAIDEVIERIQNTMCPTHRAIDGEMVTRIEGRISEDDLHALIKAARSATPAVCEVCDGIGSMDDERACSVCMGRGSHKPAVGDDEVERLAEVLQPAFFGESAKGWESEHVLDMQHAAREKAKLIFSEFPYLAPKQQPSDDEVERVRKALSDVFIKHGPFELSGWVDREEELARAAIAAMTPKQQIHPAVLEDIIRGALEAQDIEDCGNPIKCSKEIMAALRICNLTKQQDGGLVEATYDEATLVISNGTWNVEKVRRAIEDFGFMLVKRPQLVMGDGAPEETNRSGRAALSSGTSPANTAEQAQPLREAMIRLRDEMLVEASKTGSCYTCYTNQAAYVARVIDKAISTPGTCQHNWLGGGSDKFHCVHCTKCGAAHPDNTPGTTTTGELQVQGG